MLVPQTVEYALRALTELASLPRESALTASDLADRAEVPPAYMSKVLRRLVERGLVQGRKGHHGGFALARPAHLVRFVDVLTALDAMPPTNRCAFGWEKCDARAPCPLHPAMDRLNRIFAHWARSETLADCAKGLPRRGA
jgi:Rrf2 family protein